METYMWVRKPVASTARTITLLVGMVLFGAALAGCAAGPGTGPEPDANPDPEPSQEPDADAGSEWPPADTDRTDALGSPTTFDLGTWNIENFPKVDQTPAFIADLIRSMDLDLVAVQEITDEDAFEELVGRLPEHGGILSPHTYGDGSYQKVGFIYKPGVVELRDVTPIFAGNWFAFPRPPLEAKVSFVDGERELRVITVHLKATNDSESVERRTEAMQVLDAYVRGLDEDVFLLGDFNEVLTNDFGLAVWAPFADADNDYTIHTEPLALAGQVSFLQSAAILDHIVSTASLDDELTGQSARIPRLDNEFVTYIGLASDHLPVVLSMPMP